MKHRISLLTILLFLGLFHNSFSQGSGSCLSFDGNNDYIQLIDPLLNIQGDFTLEGWIKPDSNAMGWNCIWEWGDNSPINSHLYYVGDGGAGHLTLPNSLYYNFFFDNGQHRAYCSPANSINDTEWNHFALVRSGGDTTILVYINGIRQNLTPIYYFTSSPLALIPWGTGTGAENDVLLAARHSQLYGHEKIDEIRLWNVRKDSLQIRSDMCKKLTAPYSQSLIGYWNCDTGGGNVLLDQTSNGINANLPANIQEAPTWVTSGAPIGDTSTFSYSTTWSGLQVILNSSGFGNVSLSNIACRPYQGVHIYRVDELPNTLNGTGNGLPSNSTYFGTFITDYDSSYSLKFNYGNYPDAVANETSLGLYSRKDNAVTSWIDMTATQDTVGAAQNFIMDNLNARTEVILALTYVLSASFQASNASICPGTCTNFTNLSTNATSYHWSFPGSSTLVSTDTSPTNICYNTPGTYDVTLIAANANGSDTLTLSNYITVYPQPPPQGIQQNGNILSANLGFSSYQWYFEGNIIPGSTNVSFEASQNGDYNVIAIDSNGCEAEAVIYDVHIGIEEMYAENIFSISPNPTLSKFTIYSANLQQNAKVEIRNLLGEIIFSSTFSEELSVNSDLFPKGIFFVKVSDKYKYSIQKLIIQ